MRFLAAVSLFIMAASAAAIPSGSVTNFEIVKTESTKLVPRVGERWDYMSPTAALAVAGMGAYRVFNQIKNKQVSSDVLRQAETYAHNYFGQGIPDSVWQPAMATYMAAHGTKNTHLPTKAEFDQAWDVLEAVGTMFSRMPYPFN